jgi:hypothetical protein
MPGAGRVAPLLSAPETVIKIVSDLWANPAGGIGRYAHEPQPTPPLVD